MVKKSTVKKRKITPTAGMPIGVVTFAGQIFMLLRVDKKTTSTLQLLSSDNGVDFVEEKGKVVIEISEKKKESVGKCEKFSLSRTPNGYVMTYVRKGKTKEKNLLVVARSRDLHTWTVKSELPAEDTRHSTTVYLRDRDTFELYRDGLFVRCQSSHTLSVWKNKPALAFTSRHGHFDEGEISVIGSTITREGILLVYDASVAQGSQTLLQAGAVIFDKNNPKQIVWRSEAPIWQGVVEGKEKLENIIPLGFVSLGRTFILYWLTHDGNVIVVTIPALFKEVEEEKQRPKILSRFHGNPILEPRAYHDHWEGEGTFNPAAVEDDEGVIHILYRALGRDGISRVGHAQSKDGTFFENRSPFPVFEPSRGYGMPDKETYTGPVGMHPAMYTSGGGWGGSEDPRAVRIDDTIYMTFTAFEGWNSVRIGLTSISVEDFKAGKWRWKEPKLISPPGKVNKNWLLFPEKVNGKFAILHSITPKIQVDYVNDLQTFEGYINSNRPDGPQPGKGKSWENLIRGGGPPPIKTDLGWLLLYHAHDKRYHDRYRLGAMILDKDDPTIILHRCAHPLLSPDMHYENNGKPGIIYASGAIVRDGDLYVYYGGADRVCCIATTPLKNLLEYLVTGDPSYYKLKEAA